MEHNIKKYGSHIFAMYLSFLKGAKGPVMDIYKDKYHGYVSENKGLFISKYLNIFESATIPRDIYKKLHGIYKKEMGNFISDIKKIT